MMADETTVGWWPYADWSGFSRVRFYEIGQDYIDVQFADGSIYRYSDESAGRSNVEQMKQLALNGEGLLSFINKNVRFDYAGKWRGTLPPVLQDSPGECDDSPVLPQRYEWQRGEVWYCVARLDGGHPAIPSDAGFLLLATPGPGAAWGLFEVEGPRPPHSEALDIGSELESLIQNAKSYPPALAIARDILDDADEDAVPSVAEFLDEWAGQVRSILRSQPFDGYRLLESATDQPGYRERGLFYWVVGPGEAPGTVLWVDDVFYQLYQSAREDFIWPDEVVGNATHSETKPVPWPIPTWAFEEYPVVAERCREGEWRAFVDGWPLMQAFGQTREDAVGRLRAVFDGYCETGERLPRPGTQVPVKIARGHIVRAHEALAEDFISKVVGIPWGECLITDESSLWDFDGSEYGTIEEFHQRARETYGVDVSDLSTIGQILLRLAARSASDWPPFRL